VHRADNLGTFIYRVSGAFGSPHLLETYGPVQSCIGKPSPLCKDSDIVADIKKKRLEWIGNLLRIDYGSVVKKISESKPEGRRIGRQN
jgi:hypothetical protein